MMSEKNVSETHVLFWGATDKARIAERMLSVALGQFELILFDPTLPEPAYASEGRFVHSVEDLAAGFSGISHFLTCVGGTRGFDRFTISNFLQERGLTALGLRHQTAFVDDSATVGTGIQIMPMAVVHTFAQIGDFCILNTGAIIEHDCEIGHAVHVMPGATLAGSVRVEDFASLGSNATVLPGLRVGTGAIVGAGAVVTRDVPEFAVVTGVPARQIGDVRRNAPSPSVGQIHDLKTALDQTLL